jgi:hypothetical protein
MELHLKIIGILLIVLGAMHLFFPRYFYWKQELVGLSLFNRQMMYVHLFFIGFVVFLNGLLCLTSSAELLTTALGKRICLGIGIFWVVRLYVQFFGYSSKIWKGKTFETAVHVVFAGLWTYLSTVFLIVWMG